MARVEALWVFEMSIPQHEKAYSLSSRRIIYVKENGIFVLFFVLLSVRSDTPHTSLKGGGCVYVAPPMVVFC